MINPLLFSTKEEVNLFRALVTNADIITLSYFVHNMLDNVKILNCGNERGDELNMKLSMNRVSLLRLALKRFSKLGDLTKLVIKG